MTKGTVCAQSVICHSVRDVELCECDRHHATVPQIYIYIVRTGVGTEGEEPELKLPHFGGLGEAYSLGTND